MLKAINLVGVRGERSLFKRLNFQLEAGEYLLVQGENGSGKTTLLRMLTGLAKPTAGVIQWEGESLDRQWEKYRREMLYCGHLSGLKEGLSARENLQIMAAVAGTSVTPSLISSALYEVGLGGREDLPIRVLSQGQKRRATLARLLFQTGRLWILDEPLTALDLAAVQWLTGVMDRHLRKEGMIVLTSHQPLSLSGPNHIIRMGA